MSKYSSLKKKIMPFEQHKSIDIKYYIIYVLVTQSPPHFDSLPLIRTSTEYTLPVENYEFNTSDASPEEKNTYVNPSTTMQSTTDSVDIENDPHNMSNQDEGKSSLDQTNYFINISYAGMMLD